MTPVRFWKTELLHPTRTAKAMVKLGPANPRRPGVNRPELDANTKDE